MFCYRVDTISYWFVSWFGHATILGTAMQDIGFIFSLAILIISVIIHEVSHGVVANLLGDPTARLEGRLTLNPAKHFDFFGSFLVPIFTWLITLGSFTFGWAKPVPYNPYNLRAGKWGPAIVAAAGPLVNLSLALIFGFGIRLLDMVGLLTQQVADISIVIVVTNLVLAIFNLVPIPPLDGSKVLFALLPYRLRYVQEFLERNQYIVLIVFVVFLWKYVTPLVGILLRLILGI